MLLNLGKFILGLLVFSLWFFLVQNYYNCQLKGLCKEEVVQNDSFILSQLPNTLVVSCNDYIVFEGYPEFYFNHASTSAIFTEQHLNLLEGVAGELAAQPQTKLKIEACYTSSEVNTKLVQYENLGLARAMTIADKLIYEYHVHPRQLITVGKLIQSNVSNSPIKLDLIGYFPKGKGAMDKEIKIFAKQFQSSLIKVTYDARMALLRDSSVRFKLAPPIFDDYLKQLVLFLENKKDTKILLIGHTDSKLEKIAAAKEAKSFAQNMKTYLVKHGIKNPIKVEGRSNKEKQTEDIMPNGTLNKYLAAKNRRVEILLIDKK